MTYIETEYQKLISLLDDLIDEAGEDESHSFASLMEITGLLIEILSFCERRPSVLLMG